MITDKETLDQALLELNQMVHQAIALFNSKQAPDTTLEFIGVITGEDYLMPFDTMRNVSSSARLTTQTETIETVIGDYE